MPLREEPTKSSLHNDAGDDDYTMARRNSETFWPLCRRLPRPPSRGRDHSLCKPTLSGPRSCSRVLPPKIQIEFETHAGRDFSSEPQI